MSSKTEHTTQPQKPTSATDSPPKDVENFQDAVSSNGTQYRTGVKRVDAVESSEDSSDDSTTASSTVTSSDSSDEPHESFNTNVTGAAFALASDSDNWVSVDWPVAGSKNDYPPQEIREATKIRFYNLFRDTHALVYDYELQIATDKPGKYKFRDEEGDVCSLHVTGATYILGQNYANVLFYNSKKPAIKAVCYKSF